MSDKRPVLIIQLRPEDIVADSEYACILKYGGLSESETHRLRIEAMGLPSDLDPYTYSCIIVGGSPFDITTPAGDKSAIQNKIEADFARLFDEIIPADHPFLGCCSGNGLLGNYLGAAMSRQYSETTSCVHVELTAEGKQDKLLQGFPSTIDVMVGHKEAVDETPDGATLLVKGSACPVQMFRIGENVYATQFHPEADSEEFKLRIDTYRSHGYFKPHEAEMLKQRLHGITTPYGHEILRRFVDIYYRGETIHD
jgi:GMP synthase (glutamine-hydrolysing)